MQKIHSIILCDTDKGTHEKLVRAINSRKYNFEAFRKGYNRAHVSEMKIYNIRAKKEIMPFVLKDLGASTELCPEKKIRLRDVIKGPRQSGKNAFFDGRVKILSGYIIQKVGRMVRLVSPKIAERKKIPFTDGWYYVHVLGNIEDINRGMGEEL